MTIFSRSRIAPAIRWAASVSPGNRFGSASASKLGRRKACAFSKSEIPRFRSIWATIGDILRRDARSAAPELGGSIFQRLGRYIRVHPRVVPTIVQDFHPIDERPQEFKSFFVSTC